MAIKLLSKPQQAARTFLSMYTIRFATGVLIGSLVSGIFLATLLGLSHVIALWSWQYWTGMAIMTALFAIFGMTLLWALSRPMHNLIQSLAALAEASQQSPLRPIDQQASIAFQDILQPFYELSVAPTAAPAPELGDAERTVDTSITTGLDRLSCGIAMFDTDQ